MMLRGGDILGLAFTDRAILCAEVASREAGPGGSNIRKVARFTFTDVNSLDHPDALGGALALFLRQQGFSSSRVVAGVPAKWLIASEREVPPSDDASLRAMLRLGVERAGTGEGGGDVVFDYLPTSAVTKTTGGAVLLVGIMRKQLERVRTALDAAGLTIQAITSTSLAMAQLAASDAPNAAVLVLDRGGGEFIWRRNGASTGLRHVGLPSIANGNGQTSASINALGSELRRAVTLSPVAAMRNGDAANGDASLIVWDLLGLSKPQLDELSLRVGKPMRAATSNALANDKAEYGPAVALALAGTKRAVAVDLAHSRLEPEPKRGLPQRTSMLIFIGSLLLAGIVALYVNVLQRRGELNDLTAQLKQIDPEIKSAEQKVARFEYARGFFPEARTPVLECLRDVTLSFRDDEPIWVTSVSVRENGAGQLAGKSSDQRNVLSVLDRMKKSPKFKDVKLLDMRDSAGTGANRNSRDVSFSISFTYVSETPPSK